MISFAPLPADPDKRAFHRYLRSFSAAENEAQLLEQFADCHDLLPCEYARLLFLPPASTYRDAVTLLLSSWNGPLGGAYDWREEGPSFDDEFSSGGS